MIKTVFGKLAALGVGFALAASAGVAQARDDVSWSVGIGVPGVVVGASNYPSYSYRAPAPVYYAPPPVYYAPPRPVYYAPPVVYSPPPAYYYRDRGHRHHRHHRHDRGHGRWHDR